MHQTARASGTEIEAASLPVDVGNPGAAPGYSKRRVLADLDPARAARSFVDEPIARADEARAAIRL
jgi:hypothetical protein